MASKASGQGSSRGSGSAKKKATKKKTTTKKAAPRKQAGAAKKKAATAAAATKTAPDWDAVRLVYVNTALSYAKVAEQFDLSESAVEKRGERDGWAEQRRNLSEEVGQKAQEAITEQRVKDLEEFNANDLRVAKALRAQVAGAIQAVQDGKRKLSAQDVRALAGAAEVAQRMGRLALGANTDSHTHTGKDGTPLPAPQQVTFYIPDNGRGDNEGA